YVAGARRPIPKRFLVEAIEAKLLAITGQSRKRHAKRAVQVKAKLLRSLCQVEDLASHLEERSLCNQSRLALHGSTAIGLRLEPGQGGVKRGEFRLRRSRARKGLVSKHQTEEEPQSLHYRP